MVDMSAIAGAAGALKTAYDLSKAALGLHDAALIRGKITEMQREINSALASAITAQVDQMTMLENIRTLEKNVTELKKRDAEMQRYELKNLGPGAVAYMLKKDARGTEPPHWVCAHCYKKGEIFIIQFTVEGTHRQHARRGWFCPSCHNEIEPARGLVQWLD